MKKKQKKLFTLFLLVTLPPLKTQTNPFSQSRKQPQTQQPSKPKTKKKQKKILKATILILVLVTGSRIFYKIQTPQTHHNNENNEGSPTPETTPQPTPDPTSLQEETTKTNLQKLKELAKNAGGNLFRLGNANSKESFLSALCPKLKNYKL